LAGAIPEIGSRQDGGMKAGRVVTAKRPNYVWHIMEAPPKAWALFALFGMLPAGSRQRQEAAPCRFNCMLIVIRRAGLRTWQVGKRTLR
jgi:hypothetical protein